VSHLGDGFERWAGNLSAYARQVKQSRCKGDEDSGEEGRPEFRELQRLLGSRPRALRRRGVPDSGYDGEKKLPESQEDRRIRRRQPHYDRRDDDRGRKSWPQDGRGGERDRDEGLGAPVLISLRSMDA